MAALHSLQFSSIQTSVTFLFFIRFLSGLRQIAHFNKDLHFRFTCFNAAVPYKDFKVSEYLG